MEVKPPFDSRIGKLCFHGLHLWRNIIRMLRWILNRRFARVRLGETLRPADPCTAYITSDSVGVAERFFSNSW